MTDQTDRPIDHVEGVDGRWLTLQRTVAVGMIVVLAVPMVVFLQRFIPPLGIASVLFALTFVLTWFRPRAGAIGIGVLSGLWLLSQLANLPQVIPDLTQPSATSFFLVTVGMLVFSVAGLVGLVGVLRHSSGHIATRALQSVGAIVLGSLVLSLLASFS